MLDGVLKNDTSGEDTEKRRETARHMATLAMALGDVFTEALRPDDLTASNIIVRRCAGDLATVEWLRGVIKAVEAAPQGDIQRARARAAVLARLPVCGAISQNS
jgi:hypothetical protein